MRRRTPLEVGTGRICRPMTDAERGAVGLSDTTGSYISPDAHRGRCQICGRRPGSRVWCVYCRRGVGPGCCLLCEFPRTDRRRRGMCVQCLPTGGGSLNVPIQNTIPTGAANPTSSRATRNNQTGSRRRSLVGSLLFGMLLSFFAMWFSVIFRTEVAFNKQGDSRPHRREGGMVHRLLQSPSSAE